MSNDALGWILAIGGIILMFLGAWVEVRRDPSVTEAAESKNPIVAVFEAIGALIGKFTELFKVLGQFTKGRFVMAVGLIVVFLGVALVIV